MRIAIIYTGFTSYMTDCWRELSRRNIVSLKIWLEDMPAYRFAGDRNKLKEGLDLQWAYSEDLTAERLHEFEDEVVGFGPDVIFVCGWSRKLPPYIAGSVRLASVKKVLEHDMPWEWSARKIAARFLLWCRLRKFSAAFVPGETSWRYSRWLGFPSDKIFTGRYCVDLEKFRRGESRQNGFVFLGRHSPEKGLDVLRKAHGQYLGMGGSWPLVTPDFVEPKDVPAFLSQYTGFVLPSRWEPWGVVVLEALASGMRVIVSDQVGSRFDLPVDGTFKNGDVWGLANAMLHVEKMPPRLLAVKELARFDCDAWADRVISICKSL